MNEKAWKTLKKCKKRTKIDFLDHHFNLTNKNERKEWQALFSKAIIFVFESLLFCKCNILTYTTKEGVKLIMYMMPREQEIEYLPEK